MNQADVPVITIDGPTASGKGTIAHRIADALGWHYLDSGSLYRITALLALEKACSENDVRALTNVASQINPSFRAESIYLGERDVSLLIRQETVGQRASQLAVYPEVREALLARQRAFAQLPGLVADGRDMGTVVFPGAPLKIFLTASAEIRAQRRYKQLIEKGFSANLPALVADLKERDERDAHRATAPLKPALDAVLVDSSALTIEEVVNTVLWAWQQRNP